MELAKTKCDSLSNDIFGSAGSKNIYMTELEQRLRQFTYMQEG